MTQRFSLGIDLGTTNSALALADVEGEDARIVDVTQITAPNQIGEKPTLPSALYIPHPEEFPAGAVALPWQADDEGVPAIIGHFARDHGAMVPDRLITSAKSWLSNPHIDPRQPTLPWASDIDEERLSAFECSRRYLEHLKEGFLHAESRQGRTWDLDEAQIVLTVPASFDDVARTLTAEAAEAAGLGAVTLLEEPQARPHPVRDVTSRQLHLKLEGVGVVAVQDRDFLEVDPLLAQCEQLVRHPLGLCLRRRHGDQLRPLTVATARP